MSLINTDNNFPEYLQDRVEQRKCGHAWYLSAGKEPGEGPCPICKRQRQARGKHKKIMEEGKRTKFKPTYNRPGRSQDDTGDST